jgi:hypothetical protein
MKPESVDEEAVHTAAEAVGISPAKAGEIINDIWKYFREASNMYGAPEIKIDFLYTLYPSKSKIRHKALRTMIAYKVNLINVELTRLRMHRFRTILSRMLFNKKASGKEKNANALWWKNHREYSFKEEIKCLTEAFEKAEKPIRTEDKVNRLIRMLAEHFWRERTHRLERYILNKTARMRAAGDAPKGS